MTAQHPGAVLLEYLEHAGMSQRELARRVEMSPKHINYVCRERDPISPRLAIALERVLGRPASFWLNLQSNYNLQRARKETKA